MLLSYLITVDFKLVKNTSIDYVTIRDVLYVISAVKMKGMHVFTWSNVDENNSEIVVIVKEFKEQSEGYVELKVREKEIHIVYEFNKYTTPYYRMKIFENVNYILNTLRKMSYKISEITIQQQYKIIP